MPEIKTSSSVSNKPKYIILILATLCIFVFLGYFIFNDRRDSPTEKESEHTNNESIQNINSSGTEAYTKCSICGRKFTGSGYEEVSTGVWRPSSEPFQSQICSPSCGKKASNQFNKAVDDLLDATGSTLCRNCNLGHYRNNYCDRCGAASPERVKESSSNLPKCFLCNGSGIERSTMGKGGRICPACDGSGFEKY